MGACFVEYTTEPDFLFRKHLLGGNNELRFSLAKRAKIHVLFEVYSSSRLRRDKYYSVSRIDGPFNQVVTKRIFWAMLRFSDGGVLAFFDLRFFRV